MFYPKKKKLGDLEIEEVAQIFGIPVKKEEVPPNEASFYPKVRNEENTTNFGQGRIIENPPSEIVPSVRPRVVPTEEQEQPSFYPKAELSGTVTESTPLEQEYEKRRQLQTVGAPKEKSLAKRLLQGALRGMTGGIGGAITGAAIEGFYPKANTNLRTETELAKTNRNIGDLQQQETFAANQSLKKTQEENIKFDNDLNAQKQKDKVAKDTFEANQKIKRDFTNRVWSKQKYWKAKDANAIDRLELEKLGLKPEDIADFDFRDPKTKQIGGVTYQWNAQTQSFDESNLPTDGSKEIVSYDITDADGVKRTFRTTSERAAGLVTSTKNAQMQIEAAAQRQESQQQFTAQQNEEARKIARERMAIASRNVELAEERLRLAADKDKRAAQEELRKAKETRLRLKAYLKSNPLISDDADLNAELDALDDQ